MLPTKSPSLLFAVLTASISLLTGCATSTKPGAVGITRSQLILVPAATVERMALVTYAQQASTAKAAGTLMTTGPKYTRVLDIARRLQKQVPTFRDDTAEWKWSLVLINAPTINATCAPGGKMTFYTGLIDGLHLTDDEIALVMGHEIAHTLREHGRERVSQAVAQNAITQTALAATQNKTAQIALANQLAQYMLVLPNSRQNESEADKIGLELAAKAGYNPQAAITVCQKMSQASAGKQQPDFLSTHPANTTWIAELSAMMPVVMPLYSPR